MTLELSLKPTKTTAVVKANKSMGKKARKEIARVATDVAKSFEAQAKNAQTLKTIFTKASKAALKLSTEAKTATSTFENLVNRHDSLGGEPRHCG